MPWFEGYLIIYKSKGTINSLGAWQISVQFRDFTSAVCSKQPNLITKFQEEKKDQWTMRIIVKACRLRLQVLFSVNRHLQNSQNKFKMPLQLYS